MPKNYEITCKIKSLNDQYSELEDLSSTIISLTRIERLTPMGMLR